MSTARQKKQPPQRITAVRLKVVVRNLPYYLNESDFYSAINPYESVIEWKYFVKGRKTIRKEDPARAYLVFKTHDGLVKFHTQFINHVFIDAKGREHRCSIHYAPNQKAPRKGPQTDHKQGSYTEDTNYQKFLESLEKPQEYLPSAEAQFEERKKKEEIEKPKSTPILDELRAKALKPKPRQPVGRNNQKGKGKPSHSQSESSKSQEKSEDGSSESSQDSQNSYSGKSGGRSSRGRDRPSGRSRGGRDRGGRKGTWKETDRNKKMEPGTIQIQVRDNAK